MKRTVVFSLSNSALANQIEGIEDATAGFLVEEGATQRIYLSKFIDLCGEPHGEDKN